MKRIMLTGACGRLGRAIMRQGLERFEFVPVDTSPAVLNLGGVQCDLLDEPAITRAAKGCDAIIHTAATHGGNRDTASNVDFLRTNVLGTNIIFEAAARTGVQRVVTASTLTILYGTDWLGNGKSVVTESTRPALEWIYPQSKHMAEQLGHFYARTTNIEVVQLRYAWIRVVPIDSIGFGLLARSIADSDAAEAALAACVAPGLRDEVFLIGPDTPIEQRDIDAAQLDPMGTLERLFPGCTEILEAANQRPRAEEFWPIARIDRAKTMLNWRPEVTFSAYLQRLGWAPPSSVNATRPAGSAA